MERVSNDKGAMS